MFIVSSPWSDILLLAARVIGFGILVAACCRSVFSLLALFALLLAMIITFFPAVSGSEVSLGELLTARHAAGKALSLMRPLTIQFAVGLMLGVPAAGGILAVKLFAHWANALVDMQMDESMHKYQRSLEYALILLGVLSMAPFFSNFFRFFAEGFLDFRFQAPDLVLPGALWQLVSAVGKIAFATALLLLLPTFVLLLGFGLCLLFLQRFFPALLNESTTRALLIPCLLLSLAFGMYRYSLNCADSIEQSLQPSEIKKFEQLSPAVVDVK